jgi:hypothetical protein
MNRLLASILGAAAMILNANSACAASADDARVHFQAIASGDLAIVMRSYADAARLEWVGGPLDGSYASPDAIRAVWTKFAAAQGPLKLSIDKLEEAGNPKGSTVTANVMFEGKAPIKVRHVLTFRDGHIVSETWQIDPKLPMATAAY